MLDFKLEYDLGNNRNIVFFAKKVVSRLTISKGCEKNKETVHIEILMNKGKCLFLL